MSIVVRAAPETHFAWLKAKTRCALTDDFTAIEAVDAPGGAIVGMVGYCLWTPNSVYCHMATASPVVWRRLLRPALQYPFEQVGVGRLVASIPEYNKKSLSFAESVGFKRTHTIDGGWTRQESLEILELTKTDAQKWLSNERLAA